MAGSSSCRRATHYSRVPRPRDREDRRPHCEGSGSDRPPEGVSYGTRIRCSHRQDRCAGGGRMSPEISERSFEEAIECGLLQYGPDACPGASDSVREPSPPYGEMPPGGYRKRRPEEYERTLCLLP